MDILAQVAKKVADGDRLDEADALALFECPELLEIGRLADAANRRRNADVVFFNVNRHINPTNICALSCKFCAYSRKPGEEGAYAYSIDEMVQKAGEAVAQGATEVHMVGGLHPRWRLDHYKDMLKAVRSAYPNLHIKAFTAVELDWLARRARISVAELLADLQTVGLGSLPGGGAEIFDPEIRDAICETKVSAEQWLDTHRTAHRLGMHSNATMLYGHIESYHHRVDHMRRLRLLQDETRGFNAFIPLAFQPFHNEMGIDRYTYGYDDLKTLAIARLYLDNFRHVKAYWIMLGQDIAQLALSFGANDLDGTVIEEKISRMAGGRAGMAMSRSFIESLIRKARRLPCERDTLYHPLTAVPPPAPADQAAPPVVRAALNKAAYGEALSHEELLQLARHADLHELGRLASQAGPKQALATDGSFVPTVVVPFAAATSVGEVVKRVGEQVAACREAYRLAPARVTIDLAAPAPGAPDAAPAVDLGLLTELAWALRHSYAELELSVAGLKTLWSLAQEENASVRELLAQLKEAGAEVIESSPHETETDLTHTEIIELHRQVHAAELGTVAKVELMAPTHGPGEPLWDSFLKRVAAFADLAGAEALIGLSVEASPGSLVTATEYLRAVALARLAAHGVPLIIAPLQRLPVLSPVGEAVGGRKQHPAEKIASLALHYGAVDLGPIDVEKLSPIAVMRQIRAAGFRPMLRDGGLAASGATQLEAALGEDRRHLPAGLR